MNRLFSFIILAFSIISCTEDDPVITPDLSEEIKRTLQILTNNSEKSWYIKEAILLNTQSTSPLDISEAFNIKDDVFVFSTTIVDNPDLSNENGSVIWKKREAVNYNATSLDEVYKDFYEKQAVNGFTIQEDSPKNFKGLSDFTVVDENTLTGKIQVSENATLEITLTPLLDTDVAGIPNLLSFKEVTTLEFDPEGTNVLGLIGSNQSNTLYIGRRGTIASQVCEGLKRFDEIVTYNLTSNTYDTKSFCQGSEFSTKELEVIDGRLVVAASDSNNIYDLGLNGDPSVTQHGEFLSRFGTAAFENDIYITGSKIDVVESTVIDQLFRFNVQSKAFEIFETLPVPKVWADTEVVDDKLYIFGGQDNNFDNIIGSNDVLIYDFTTTEWQTKSMSKAVNDTFTGKYKNLIFVGGKIFIDNDGNGNLDTYEGFLGAYNTMDDTFSEIGLEFDVPMDGFLEQLTVLNNKVYLLTSTTIGEYTFKLYEAELK